MILNNQKVGQVYDRMLQHKLLKIQISTLDIIELFTTFKQSSRVGI